MRTDKKAFVRSGCTGPEGDPKMKNSGWRKVPPAQKDDRRAQGDGPLCLDSLRLELLRRGVPETASEAVAKQLQASMETLEGPEAGRVLDAMALAFVSGALHARDAAAPGPEGRDARRLADDLRSEVRKLDEIVKVLNAYLARFRASRSDTRERRLQ